jgi:hypothetical protein
MGGIPMAKIFIALVLSMFLGFLMSNAAHAGIRCGTEVVTEGDTTIQVLSTCGEPEYVDSWAEERIKRDFFPYSSYNSPYSSPFNRDRYSNRDAYRQPFLVKEQVVIERWTYSFGSNRFIHYLFFENGVLVQISQGPRGRY